MSFDVSFMTHSVFTFADDKNDFDFHELLVAKRDRLLCGVVVRG